MKQASICDTLQKMFGVENNMLDECILLISTGEETVGLFSLLLKHCLFSVFLVEVLYVLETYTQLPQVL